DRRDGPRGCFRVGAAHQARARAFRSWVDRQQCAAAPLAVGDREVGRPFRGSRHPASGSHDGPAMTRESRGFPLVEAAIALAIERTLLVVLFSGLRVGLAAWQRGDERSQALERARSVNQIVTRTLAGAYPYQAAAIDREPARLLFEGEPERVAFAT